MRKDENFKTLRVRLVSGIGIRIPKNLNSLFGCTKMELEYEVKCNTYSNFGPKKGFCNSTQIGVIGIRIPIPFFFILENINFGVREFPSNIG